MAYNPVTDFLALIRKSGSSVAIADMPGLDFVVAALARAGLFMLATGQTPPTTNQTFTVWIKPSSPSWVAEGTVYLWNIVTEEYEVATEALWSALLNPAAAGATAFQSVASSAGLVAVNTTLLAIVRANPANTALTLPSVTVRNDKALQIVDWSSAVVSHQVVLIPAAGETIMRLGAFTLLSSPDQLAGVTLYPSIDLNGWVIAP